MPFDYDFQMQIGVPRAVVFERLLRIEHLSRWFCGWCRIEPKVGGTFKFGGETCILLPDGRSWETTIDEGDVLRRFAFTWPIRSERTRVSHELEDGDHDTTILRVRHRGVPLRETTCGAVQDAWRMCLGNLKSVSEGRGDSVRPDHSEVVTRELRLSALIEATVPKVFAAFDDPAQLAKWSAEGTANSIHDVEHRVGGEILLGGAEGTGRILEWEPNRRVRIQQDRRPEDLIIGFDLEEKASGTAVYFSETGFRADEPHEIRRHRGRWSDLLVCLKNFVESGSTGFLNPYQDQGRES